MIPASGQAVLFDVDGTLIDSNGAHARSWTETLIEHGVATAVDHVRRFIGMGGDKLLPAVAGISETSDRGQVIVRGSVRAELSLRETFLFGGSMRVIRNVVIVLALSSVALATSACPEKKGPAEKAGEQIDKAIDKTKDAAKDATK